MAYYGAGDGAAEEVRAMLLRSVFAKQVRDLRWPTFWVSLGMGGMTGYFALLFPTYSKLFDLNDMLAKMGPAAKLLARAWATPARSSASST